MHTKIHWARKSQKPLAMAWRITRGKLCAPPVRNCTTDKKKKSLLQVELLLTSSMIATKSMTKLTVDRM